ncbi:MAG: MFS transporter [Thermodesulfobacteriales bacterium]|jgi:MFS family permease|nr:MAG: MFS transporter [Thermodesulfobacteriales bacterium]
MSKGSSNTGLFGWVSEINSDQWKAFYAALLGWTLDAMDLLLFAFAVGSIGKVFNLSEAWVGALFSVTLFSSAFGGAVFGVISDYIGRVRALTYSILLYSLFTGISAFAPTVTFLLVCRVFLGFGMGGEWASGEVLVAEKWPNEHRGKVIGMVQSGWGIGYILAAILATLIIPNLHEGVTYTIPILGIQMDGLDLGWRILFLIGVLPAFLVFYIRRHLDEPEVWKKNKVIRDEVKLSGKAQAFTLKQIFAPDLLRYTITATLLTSLCMIAYWGLYFWLPQFLASDKGVGLDTKGFIWIIPINIGAFIGCNTFGFISDKVGRRPVFVAYLLIMAVLVWFFGHATTLKEVLILGPFVGFFGTGFYSGFGAIFAEIFPTRARGTAQGFCYNVGRGVSAIAPPMIGYIVSLHGFAIGLTTVSVFAVAAAVVVMTLPETKGKALDLD